MHLQCDGFDLDYEIAAKLQVLSRRLGQKIIELPISYTPRTVAEGEKNQLARRAARAYHAVAMPLERPVNESAPARGRIPFFGRDGIRPELFFRRTITPHESENAHFYTDTQYRSHHRKNLASYS